MPVKVKENISKYYIHEHYVTSLSLACSNNPFPGDHEIYNLSSGLYNISIYTASFYFLSEEMKVLNNI